MAKHYTDGELERLARRIWYAPRHVASGYTDRNGKVTQKSAFMDSVGIADGRKVEFDAPLGGRTVGEFVVHVQYPHWDFPGMITVRKAKPVV